MHGRVIVGCVAYGEVERYAFELEFLLEGDFALVQAAEAVDLVLVFAADFDAVSLFVFFRELGSVKGCCELLQRCWGLWGISFGRTIRRCTNEAMMAVISRLRSIRLCRLPCCTRSFCYSRYRQQQDLGSEGNGGV